jgi:ribonuclease-3
MLTPEIQKVLTDRHKKDYKTLLQEYVQKTYKTYPRYHLVKRTGPDHDRTFWIEVSFGDRKYGPGSGKNKKDAEQMAAGIAFKQISEDLNISSSL